MLALYGRPQSWNWLLMLHVTSAFILLGAVLAVALISVSAWRQEENETAVFLRSAALRTNLIVVLPAFVSLYVFGGWLANKEGLDDKTPSWLDAAFPLTDLSGLVGIVVLSGFQYWVLRRARAGRLTGWPAAVATWLSPAVLGLLLVVLFLMAGKPD